MADLNFTTKTINVGTLDIDLTGSETVFLKGNAETCKIDIAGSGNLKSSSLSIKYLCCDITKTKNRNAVSESIKYDIAGSKTITYTGNSSPTERILPS